MAAFQIRATAGFVKAAGRGAGLDDVFRDIVARSRHCRFADCRHRSEPGCAVLAAIERGELDRDRLRRYLKLMAENAQNAASLAERRARDRDRDRDRAFGKMVKGIVRRKRRDGQE